MPEDSATSALAFTIGDVETAVGSLTVTATSSNTTLIPDANLVFGGSGATRTLTATPAANQFGTSTITVTVSDGTATTSDTFVLTVTAVNDAPTIAGLNAADLIFLGPGSPSRALRRWGGTPIVEQLIARIQNGATLIASSAAAAASGRHTIPVYEIYKAGTNPVWLDGLDIIGALTGLAVAVVPHWNNNEGATHDTSRCFIGEGRLQHRVCGKLPVEDGFVDPGQILINDTAGTDVHMTDFGIAHLAIWQTDETALGMDQGIRAFGQQAPPCR